MAYSGTAAAQQEEKKTLVPCLASSRAIGINMRPSHPDSTHSSTRKMIHGCQELSENHVQSTMLAKPKSKARTSTPGHLVNANKVRQIASVPMEPTPRPCFKDRFIAETTAGKGNSVRAEHVPQRASGPGSIHPDVQQTLTGPGTRFFFSSPWGKRSSSFKGRRRAHIYTPLLRK